MKYKFKVGIAGNRSISVNADSLEDARTKAREVLDRLAEKRGKEPPVGWDLVLIGTSQTIKI